MVFHLQFPKFDRAASAGETSKELKMTLAKTIISVALMAVLVGCEDGSASDSFEFGAGIEHIIVNVDFGDITLHTNRVRDGAEVNTKVDCRTASAHYDVYVEDATLYVEMIAGMDASACDGAVEIIVPAAVSIDARTASGDIEIDGIDGDAKIVTFDGNIALTDIAGDLEVAAVSGDVTGVELQSARNTVTLGAGNAALSFAQTPHLVDVDIIMGNATLTVPHNTYRIDAVTESGLVNLDGVNNLPSADKALSLAIESGDILIAGN